MRKVLLTEREYDFLKDMQYDTRLEYATDSFIQSEDFKKFIEKYGLDFTRQDYNSIEIMKSSHNLIATISIEDNQTNIYYPSPLNAEQSFPDFIDGVNIDEIFDDIVEKCDLQSKKKGISGNVTKEVVDNVLKVINPRIVIDYESSPGEGYIYCSKMPDRDRIYSLFYSKFNDWDPSVFSINDFKTEFSENYPRGTKYIVLLVAKE